MLAWVTKRKVRILPAESLRFPEEGSSAQGKPGPKPRQKCVGEGQLVDIPVPPEAVWVMGWRRRVSAAHRWLCASKRVGSGPRQIRVHVNPETRWGAKLIVANWLIPYCREKPLARRKVPVPQTDTGRRGENPKARGKTLVKELGKLTP